MAYFQSNRDDRDSVTWRLLLATASGSSISQEYYHTWLAGSGEENSND